MCRLAHGLASANTPARSVRTGETPALLPVPRISGKRPVRRRVDKTFRPRGTHTLGKQKSRPQSRPFHRISLKEKTDDHRSTDGRQTLRDRARKNIQEGAVTEGYSADRQTVLRLLNEALATELVCFLRYKRHYFMATGLKASIAAAEFLEHANQEMQHADQLAERIMQLGGEPDFNPRGLEERSHAEYVEGKTLKDMVTENLIAERIAIDSYREIITYLGNDDPTTRRIFEEILAQEEEHADDMADILDDLA